MTTSEIAFHRQNNHLLTNKKLKDAAQVVEWLGAVQAQDYLASKWAVGIRLQNATDLTIEKAIANKSIVRSWSFRGTLHLMAANDINWMIDLVSPAYFSKIKGRHKQLELDDAVFKKFEKLFSELMKDHEQVSRKTMFDFLDKNGIATKDQRGIHLMLWASQRKLLCHGTMEGKQFTYAAYDKWIKPTKELTKEEALQKLALRYFTSHGPATLPDFMFWSGFGANDSKKALEAIKPQLSCEIVNGTDYWFHPENNSTAASHSSAFLLPAFDEYFLGYRDREISIEKANQLKVMSINGIFYPALLINDRIVGTWKRTLKKDKVVIELQPFSPLTKKQLNLIAPAINDYAKFLGLKPETS